MVEVPEENTTIATPVVASLSSLLTLALILFGIRMHPRLYPKVNVAATDYLITAALGGYNHEIAYNNSKLAAVYLANKIERDYGAQGLHSTSLHPGAINTDISRNIPPEFVEALMTNPYILKILKWAEQGAATTVWAAVGKEWENNGGKYLEDVREAEQGEDDGQIFGGGWVKQTYNPEEEDRLWRASLKILNLEGEA
ncbi:hypothetical protein CNMCM5793_005258 [Aspergillus hiratsukae]|uniref:Uncharacterized protein n=1 Tax=Aspergillus hiratsukae TaxID=1194566 RepID=A0A8H6PGR6_9EURO|nr:hypothetical protein CNMCM5793_005258 [Aspergillus hiratsukae]